MRFSTALFILLLSSFGNANPLERYDPESVAEAVALAEQISSSEWIYKWRGHSYRFVFEKDGSISKLESWNDVRWRIVGANEIVLEGYTDRMHLFFDNNIRKFTTFDWDGTRATGILAR